MKDGTKLCPDFQTGKCKSAKCNKGAHRCAVILRAQRVWISGARGIRMSCQYQALRLPRDRGRDARPWIASPETLSEAAPSLVVDLMCGPNAPITKAFLFCGRRSVPVDWVLGAGEELCSRGSFTKSRAREIHPGLPSGRQLPKPLRSEQHPMGVPGLGIEDQRQVCKDSRQ